MVIMGYRKSSLVLVRHGKGSQVAVVLDVKGQSFLGRKWLESTATLAAPQWIPLRRIVGRPAKDDTRRGKVREAMEGEG